MVVAECDGHRQETKGDGRRRDLKYVLLCCPRDAGCARFPLLLDQLMVGEPLLTINQLIIEPAKLLVLCISVFVNTTSKGYIISIRKDIIR